MPTLCFIDGREATNNDAHIRCQCHSLDGSGTCVFCCYATKRLVTNPLTFTHDLGMSTQFHARVKCLSAQRKIYEWIKIMLLFVRGFYLTWLLYNVLGLLFISKTFVNDCYKL